MTNFDIYDFSGADDKKVENIKKAVKNNWIAILITSVFVALFILFVILYSKEEKINDNLQDELNKCHVDLSTSKAELKTEVDACKASLDTCNADLKSLLPVNEPSSFSNNEQFTNDLPYQLNNGSVTLVPDNDYNETLQKMSLDNAVFSQHARHVKDGNKITSTASFSPSRSDNQDIVTSWGLSRPTYVPIDPSARNVPSQDPEQGSKPVRLQWK
jgi:uncharacterized membrane-anchored protein YhcB (DUF1043 family)